MDKKYIECGKIVNTHGCKGALKAESWCNSEKDLASLKRIFLKNGVLYSQYDVIKASIFKQFVIFELNSVDDMDKAAAMKGTTLYASRDDFELGEGDFFIADLLGLPVIDNIDGKVYGRIKDIINRGASDIYVVTTPTGERMIPVVDEFVKRVDLESGIYVETIPGLLSYD